MELSKQASVNTNWIRTLVLIVQVIPIFATADVNVMYLRGVPQLDNSSYYDYYFSCNTIGLTLQWEVNGSPLGGYMGGAVGYVFSSSRSGYKYTATLLSSKWITGRQYTFDSVLIVSLLGSSNLNVTCRNGPSSFESVNNAEIKADVKNQVTDDSVYLVYLLTLSIVSTNGYSTSIFVCGVKKQFMTWQTNTRNFEFTASDAIGHFEKNLEQNGTIVKEQAIRIAHGPYLVSVLFITSTSEGPVICGYNQTHLSLTSSLEDTTTSDSIITLNRTTDPVMTTILNHQTNSTTMSSTSTGGGTETTTSDSSTLLYIIIGVVIPVGLVCAVIVIVIVMVAYKHREKKRNQQPQPQQPQPQQPLEITLQDRNQQPQLQQLLEIPLQNKVTPPAADSTYSSAESLHELALPINQHQQPQRPQQVPLQDRVITPPSEADSTYASAESLHESHSNYYSEESLQTVMKSSDNISYRGSNASSSNGIYPSLQEF